MKLVSVSDAAKEKGVSREAIYQAIQQGRLKVRRVIGKIGVLRNSLDAYQPDANKIRAGCLRARPDEGRNNHHGRVTEHEGQLRFSTGSAALQQQSRKGR